MKTASVSFKTTQVNGFKIFYREAGDPQAPAVLLLHGFPTSSHMFRNPDRISAVISQNGNVHVDGLSDDWAPVRAYWENPNQQNRDALRSLSSLETTRWQYHHGVTNAEERIAPEAIALDQAL